MKLASHPLCLRAYLTSLSSPVGWLKILIFLRCSKQYPFFHMIEFLYLYHLKIYAIKFLVILRFLFVFRSLIFFKFYVLCILSEKEFQKHETCSSLPPSLSLFPSLSLLTPSSIVNHIISKYNSLYTVNIL